MSKTSTFLIIWPKQISCFSNWLLCLWVFFNAPGISERENYRPCSNWVLYVAWIETLRVRTRSLSQNRLFPLWFSEMQSDTMLMEDQGATLHLHGSSVSGRVSSLFSKVLLWIFSSPTRPKSYYSLKIVRSGTIFVTRYIHQCDWNRYKKKYLPRLLVPGSEDKQLYGK